MKVTFKLFRCHSVEIRRLSLLDTIPLFSSVSEFMSNSNFLSKKTAPYICTKLKTQIVKKTRTGPRPWWSFDFRALIGSSTCSVRLIAAGKQSRPIAVHASREHQWLLRFSRTIRRFIDPVELIYYRFRNSKFRNRTACEMLSACSYWKKIIFFICATFNAVYSATEAKVSMRMQRPIATSSTLGLLRVLRFLMSRTIFSPGWIGNRARLVWWSPFSVSCVIDAHHGRRWFGRHHVRMTGPKFIQILTESFAWVARATRFRKRQQPNVPRARSDINDLFETPCQLNR